MTDQNEFGWVYLSPLPGIDADCHSIPVNDLLPHELSSECWCQPEDDLVCDQYFWLHNAKDGREDYETNIRKPN